jgi:hypothetical protein
MSQNWRWFILGSLIDKLSTFSPINYELLPKIENYEPFNNIKTMVDLKNNLNTIKNKFISPVSGHFEFDGEIFYRDQQDCVMWALNSETGQVYVINIGDTKLQLVANSLPEFLKRIYLENQAWFYIYEEEVIEPETISYFKELRKNLNLSEKPKSYRELIDLLILSGNFDSIYY